MNEDIDGYDAFSSCGPYVAPFKTQLLKWIGNKQKFAHHIASIFPTRFNKYYEPFLGSGAVLGTLAPSQAIASDIFKPLIEIWTTLSHNPKLLKTWYQERWELFCKGNSIENYELIKSSYNRSPNGADLLFLCRSCYGGVVRFRKTDGYMSTPCGVHDPISPESFSKRVDLWHAKTSGVQFLCADYQKMMLTATSGDLIYCDPPYMHSQGILYGAQEFSLEKLFEVIEICKSKNVFVVLSIDGMKKSGKTLCNLPIPNGLFARQLFVDCGRSMLRRFQMGGETLEDENVKDRLLLTY